MEQIRTGGDSGESSGNRAGSSMDLGSGVGRPSGAAFAKKRKTKFLKKRALQNRMDPDGAEDLSETALSEMA